MNYNELTKYFKRDMTEEELTEFSREMLNFNGTIIRDQSSAKLALLKMNRNGLSDEEYRTLLGLTIGVGEGSRSK